MCGRESGWGGSEHTRAHFGRNCGVWSVGMHKTKYSGEVDHSLRGGKRTCEMIRFRGVKGRDIRGGCRFKATPQPFSQLEVACETMYATVQAGARRWRMHGAAGPAFHFGAAAGRACTGTGRFPQVCLMRSGTGCSGCIARKSPTVPKASNRCWHHIGS